MTVPEVGRYLRLGPATVGRAIDRGEIPAVVDRQRRVRVVRRSHVDAWVRQRRIKPGSLAHLDANRWPKHREPAAEPTSFDLFGRVRPAEGGRWIAAWGTGSTLREQGRYATLDEAVAVATAGGRRLVDHHPPVDVFGRSAR